MATSPTGQEGGKEETASFQLEVSSPELQVYSTETRIEEVLPDGTRRVLVHTNELTLSRGRRIQARIRLPRWVVVLGVVILAVIIGLIAVGPTAVWEWLAGAIDSLIN